MEILQTSINNHITREPLNSLISKWRPLTLFKAEEVGRLEMLRWRIFFIALALVSALTIPALAP